MPLLLTPFTFASLLCTRFCHDMAGPIGALNNGLEYIADDREATYEQAVELLTLSAKEALARLQFFRYAYGVPNYQGEANLATLKHVADQFFRNTKIILEWPERYAEGSGLPVGGAGAQLLLNIIFAVSQSLMRGGTLSVQLAEENEGISFHIRGSSDKILHHPQHYALITGESGLEAADAKTVQILYVAELANLIAAKLNLSQGADFLELHAHYTQSKSVW